MNPLPATKALDAYFLEARCRLLDLAAILDRIQRGEQFPDVQQDARLKRIAEAIRILAQDTPNRAELIQKLFSQEYDPNWVLPEPR